MLGGTAQLCASDCGHGALRMVHTYGFTVALLAAETSVVGGSESAPEPHCAAGRRRASSPRVTACLCAPPSYSNWVHPWSFCLLPSHSAQSVPGVGCRCTPRFVPRRSALVDRERGGRCYVDVSCVDVWRIITHMCAPRTWGVAASCARAVCPYVRAGAGVLCARPFAVRCAWGAPHDKCSAQAPLVARVVACSRGAREPTWPDLGKENGLLILSLSVES